MMLRISAAVVAALLAGCATVEQGPPLEVVTIHEAPGKTKSDVCRAARDWAALTFRDSKAVVEVYDLEAGTMIGKGRIVVSGYAATPFNVDFTLRVECRDGRARSTFDSFATDGGAYGRQPLREDALNNLKTKAEGRTRELAAALSSAISAPARGSF